MPRVKARRSNLAAGVLAMGTVLQAIWIVWMWLADKHAPAFMDLGTTPRNWTVLVLHHKRLPELEATLRSLALVPAAWKLNVIVSQSLEPLDAYAYNRSSMLVRALASELSLHVSLQSTILTQALPDGSYSVDAKRFGTKRNSFRNLVHGLSIIFDAVDAPVYAAVLEDDVEVSSDLFELFDLGAALVGATCALEPQQASSSTHSDFIVRHPRNSHTL